MTLNDERLPARDSLEAQISMVPQAAMNALNPVMRIGDQVAEPVMVHMGLTRKTRWPRRCACLNRSVCPPTSSIATPLS